MTSPAITYYIRSPLFGLVVGEMLRRLKESNDVIASRLPVPAVKLDDEVEREVL
jgi:hypothetical protein